MTRLLLEITNGSRELHVVPAIVRNYFSIRFCVCAEHAREIDIERAWLIFRKNTEQILCVRPNHNIGQSIRCSMISGSKRFFLTREVSQDQFEILRKKLHDGATPVVVLGSEPHSTDELSNTSKR